MNPIAEETYRVLGLVLGMTGELDDARRVLAEALILPETNTYTRATLGYVLARAGQRDETLAILSELEDHATHTYVSPVAFATIHLGLGDVDRALDWTERARAERRGWLAYLKVNPIMDPMREHPRFAELVRQMRL
jgi:tetratricopeptide (TPR) repeat protein